MMNAKTFNQALRSPDHCIRSLKTIIGNDPENAVRPRFLMRDFWIESRYFANAAEFMSPLGAVWSSQRRCWYIPADCKPKGFLPREKGYLKGYCMECVQPDCKGLATLERDSGMFVCKDCRRSFPLAAVPAVLNKPDTL